MGEPSEGAPPGHDGAESDGAEDLFGDQDSSGATPAAVLHTVAGKEKEELM